VLRFPPILPGASGLSLAAASVFAWLALPAPRAAGADDALPLPPSLPRLGSGPQYEDCLELTRADPDLARAAAERWEAMGGGEAARHCLALALLGQGDPSRAAERMEALAMRSDAPAAARAAVYGQAAEAWTMARQPGRAFAAATLGLILMPDDVELLTSRAMTLVEMGRTAEAIGDLDRVLAIEPRRVEALVLRAAGRRRLDRIAEAEADVAHALQLAPDSAEALLERGILRQLRGDTAGAVRDWQRAVALAPDTPTADLAAQNLALNEAGPPRR
jgi:tetratricopeptide (TPR) repeat protein